MHAAMSPIVFAARPSSWALLMPSCREKCSDQAMVVPTPPVSEMEPTISPARGSIPKTLASPMPVAFCRRMKTSASAVRIRKGRPPAANVRRSLFKPMAAKKYSSRTSRVL